MPNTRNKGRGARKRVQKRTPKPRSRRKTADEKAFTESLIAHGQAVKPAADGKLPSGATHELVEDDRGEVRAVRRRFSAV
jgi:hypothetical protein